MKITQLQGILEIDHNRGVIYFHCSDPKQIKKYGVTVLRICQLPKPIPERALDITHMSGADWVTERNCPICKGTGKVKTTSFRDSSKLIEQSCSTCKGKGHLEKLVLPNSEE